MKSYLTLLVLAATGYLFSDCTSDSQAGSKAKLPKALPPLEQSQIYNEDLVVNYLFDSEERDTDSAHQASRKLFLQAIDLYKNKKDPKSALPIFIKSIVLYPDSKSYHELGDLLYESGEYKECLSAYKIAVTLDYSPLADTYYNMACASAMTDDYSGMALSYLGDAFTNGFQDSLKYVSDPHLTKIRGEEGYRNYLFTHFVKNDSRKDNIKFNLFLERFQELPVPFEIKAEDVGKYEGGNYIGYDFSDFIDEMENVSFGRDVSNEFCYVGTLKKTDLFTAVLYSSVEMMGGYLPPVYTMIVSYNPQGEVIAKKVFACQASGEKIKTGSYDGSVITVIEKKILWEKPFDEASPDENKITGYEDIETSKYTLDESGMINAVTGI